MKTKSQKRNIRDVCAEAEVMRDDADRLIHQELVRRGWEYTSDTPGSIWMWKKVLDGGALLAPRSVAVDIETQADEYADVPSEIDED